MKLKPCPFCGGSPIGPERSMCQPGYFYVECERCEIVMDGSSKHQAIDAWNRRPDQWRPIEEAPKDVRVMQFGGKIGR